MTYRNIKIKTTSTTRLISKIDLRFPPHFYPFVEFRQEEMSTKGIFVLRLKLFVNFELSRINRVGSRGRKIIFYYSRIREVKRKKTEFSVNILNLRQYDFWKALLNNLEKHLSDARISVWCENLGWCVEELFSQAKGSIYKISPKCYVMFFTLNVPAVFAAIVTMEPARHTQALWLELVASNRFSSFNLRYSW